MKNFLHIQKPCPSCLHKSKTLQKPARISVSKKYNFLSPKLRWIMVSCHLSQSSTFTAFHHGSCFIGNECIFTSLRLGRFPFTYNITLQHCHRQYFDFDIEKECTVHCQDAHCTLFCLSKTLCIVIFSPTFNCFFKTRQLCRLK